jgi:hypothetical protein
MGGLRFIANIAKIAKIQNAWASSNFLGVKEVAGLLSGTYPFPNEISPKRV